MKWTVEENALLGDQGLVVEGRRNVALCFAKRDAALIAAAPEMYEACKLIIENLKNRKGTENESMVSLSDIIKVKAALAKARGGENEPA